MRIAFDARMDGAERASLVASLTAFETSCAIGWLAASSFARTVSDAFASNFR